MTRWDREEKRYVGRPDVDAFLADVVAVCRKHGFSIGQEDSEGAFIIEAASEANFDWLKRADVGR